MKSGKIFFISGPSGVGKGTIINILREKYKDVILFPPSCTTRDPRPGEVDGETYYFISKEEFQERIEKGEFLEYAQVHNGNYYGTLKEKLVTPAEEGKIVIREFDVQGFSQARERLDRDLYSSLFLTPDFPTEVLIDRIKMRSPLTEEEIQQREKSMKNELESAHIYDYIVPLEDGNIDTCVSRVENVIWGELRDSE